MLKYHLHHKEHKIHHPAATAYILTIALLGLTVLFGFITVFVPWAMKDIGVGQRAWAFPFKTCIEDPFSNVNQETCIDNDFIEPTGAPITQGSQECKGYILATIAFVFIYVLIGAGTIILLGYILEHLWWAPLTAAWVAQGLMIFVCIASIIAWIMFIVYAEMTCVPNSIFPVRGFSYGWIMTLFATALSAGAVATGFWGIREIKVYKYIEDKFAEAEKHIPGATPYVLLPPISPMMPLSVPAPAPSPAYIISSRPQSPYPYIG